MMIKKLLKKTVTIGCMVSIMFSGFNGITAKADIILSDGSHFPSSPLETGTYVKIPDDKYASITGNSSVPTEYTSIENNYQSHVASKIAELSGKLQTSKENLATVKKSVFPQYAETLSSFEAEYYLLSFVEDAHGRVATGLSRIKYELDTIAREAGTDEYGMPYNVIAVNTYDKLQTTYDLINENVWLFEARNLASLTEGYTTRKDRIEEGFQRYINYFSEHDTYFGDNMDSVQITKSLVTLRDTMESSFATVEDVEKEIKTLLDLYQSNQSLTFATETPTIEPTPTVTSTTIAATPMVVETEEPVTTVAPTPTVTSTAIVATPMVVETEDPVTTEEPQATEEVASSSAIDVSVEPAPNSTTISSGSAIKLGVSKKTLGVGDQFNLQISTDNAYKITTDVEGIVMINSMGYVTGLSKGSAVITVSAGGETATCKVTVKKAPKAANIKVKTKKVKKGKTISVKPTFTGGTYCLSVKYSSSNKKVAKVTSNGKVKGLKKGTTKITIKCSTGAKKVIKVKVV